MSGSPSALGGQDGAYRPNALGSWCSRLLLLVTELIGYRYRRSRAAVLLAIGEPIGLIAFFTLLQRMSGAMKPPFGSSAPLFYVTGVLPMYLFFHTSLRFRTWDYLPRFPVYNEFELALAQVIAEFVSKLFIIFVCTSALYLSGTPDALPVNPFICAFALAILAIFGAGLGMVNAVIAGFFFPWTYIYQVLIRGWMVFSGILFVVDFMPPMIRNAASWVPITHAVVLYRTGQYATFPHQILDLQYLLGATLFVVALGWLCESGTRQWRSFR